MRGLKPQLLMLGLFVESCWCTQSCHLKKVIRNMKDNCNKFPQKLNIEYWQQHYTKKAITKHENIVDQSARLHFLKFSTISSSCLPSSKISPQNLNQSSGAPWQFFLVPIIWKKWWYSQNFLQFCSPWFLHFFIEPPFFPNIISIQKCGNARCKASFQGRTPWSSNLI